MKSDADARVLSVPRIVFMVVAAAAPLASMVGTLPIALGSGNGAGVPTAFLVATLTLLCFAVGYAQMSRRVVNTGAFYSFVTLGAGKAAGVCAAFIALVAYTTFTIGLAALFGYFSALSMQSVGVNVPWFAYAAVGMLLVAVLGYRSIDLSSKLLGILMLAEMTVLMVFDVSVVAARGWSALPAASFVPGVAFVPGFAVALMFAYTSFVGFESAALYGEEARDPAKSVPRATYAAVLLIGGFYLTTAWITVGALGASHAQTLETAQGGELMFALIGQFSGDTMKRIASVLLSISFLAAYLAIHNAAARYAFALSREQLLPKALSKPHSRRPPSSRASIAVSLVTIVFVSAYWIAGADPYEALIPSQIGLGTLGIIILQALAAIAIILYFRALGSGDVWRTRIAPAVGAVGLSTAALLVASNFGLLVAVEVAWGKTLPLVYGATCIAALAFAWWLRRRRPDVYAALAAVELRSEDHPPAKRAVSYDGRYCIIGAGPSGLLAARAFKLEGIPFDHFERHTEVGGIWDIDNPGSSMYESAHFISSKYTSGFIGFPMPESYPDYPGHRQIHAYIRAFAEAYGLRAGVTFGCEVEHAEPLGDGGRDDWRVTLAGGETRVYRGLVCATGVTWHPNTPSYPGLDRFAGQTRHSVAYRSAADLRNRRVLIVGGGNSGVDIACEAAANAEAAFLSVRRGYRIVPKHIFGVPADVFLSDPVRPPEGVQIPEDPNALLDALAGDLTRYGFPAPDHNAFESHPILNSQILHHLGHGRLTVKRDVREFVPGGAIFTDGTSAEFDMILFATGYEYRIPYLDASLFDWNRGHPELYLNVFHRKLEGLAVIGFIEFASAAYQRFDEMVQLAVMDAHLRQEGTNYEDWLRLKANHCPNLRGEMAYIDSARHASYVDVDAYRKALREVRARFGWPELTRDYYSSLLKSGSAGHEASPQPSRGFRRATGNA